MANTKFYHAQNDNITAAPESKEAGRKEGGETLKLPLQAFHTFSSIMEICWLYQIGTPDFDKTTLNDSFLSLMDMDETPEILRIEDEYLQLYHLLELYENTSDYKETIATAIQEKADEIGELFVDMYPVLKPIYDAFVEGY